VQDTITVISLILERTDCIAGVQTALEAGDYEQAARSAAALLAGPWGAVHVPPRPLELAAHSHCLRRHVHSFLELDGKLDASAGAVDSAQVEQQRQVGLGGGAAHPS
jgi:hypothetical protein